MCFANILSIDLETVTMIRYHTTSQKIMFDDVSGRITKAETDLIKIESHHVVR